MKINVTSNLRCNVMQTDSYGWSMDGTRNGMMALYAEHKIDLLLHETSMQADQMQYAEFTTDLFSIE